MVRSRRKDITEGTSKHLPVLMSLFGVNCTSKSRSVCDDVCVQRKFLWTGQNFKRRKTSDLGCSSTQSSHLRWNKTNQMSNKTEPMFTSIFHATEKEKSKLMCLSVQRNFESSFLHDPLQLETNENTTDTCAHFSNTKATKKAIETCARNSCDGEQ